MSFRHIKTLLVIQHEQSTKDEMQILEKAKAEYCQIYPHAGRNYQIIRMSFQRQKAETKYTPVTQLIDYVRNTNRPH